MKGMIELAANFSVEETSLSERGPIRCNSRYSLRGYWFIQEVFRGILSFEICKQMNTLNFSNEVFI